MSHLTAPTCYHIAVVPLRFGPAEMTMSSGAKRNARLGSGSFPTSKSEPAFVRPFFAVFSEKPCAEP